MTMFLVAMLFSVRTLDSTAANTLDLAMNHSAITRQLVASLERSNVIVHIQSSRELPAGIGGMTRFVVSRGGYRYLRITISETLTVEARVAILAHELQHACEIAESRADDVAGLRELFGLQGHRDGAYYDTPAAIRVQRSVLGELRGLQAEPVIKFDH